MMAMESAEQVARRIADAAPGIYPVSKLREAIYQTAVIEVRKLKRANAPDDGGTQEAEFYENRHHYDDR